MSNFCIRDFSNSWWSEIYNRIIGAVVFLDDNSCECLHWHGGVQNLLSAGAVSVRSLSPFEYCKSEFKKAVFIIQTTLVQLKTVREIINRSSFSHCILISTVGLEVIYLEINDGQDVSDNISQGKAHKECSQQLEALLMEWIGKEPSAVEVVHIPIFTISLTRTLFLTPPYCSVYPLFNGQLIPKSASLDLYSLNDDERSMTRRFASNFNMLFDSLNIKEDIFYMGSYSSLIAAILENSPVYIARRKNCSVPISFILIDRTLDVCGVTSHCKESVLDKIMTVLHRFPGHCTDVAINMSSLCKANVTNHPNDITLSPGCLYDAHSEQSCKTFEHMINKSQKEVMFDLYNKLSAIDVQRSPGPKNILKVTSQSLEKIISASKCNYEVIHDNVGVLQQALAVVQMLKSPKSSQMELMMSLERQALQSITASRDSTSVLLQIDQLLKSRRDRNMSLDSLLALLVYVYSLSGAEVTFSQQHENTLMETLSVAIFEDHKILFGHDEIEKVTPELCDDLSSRIISRLRDIAKMRVGLQRYNSVLKSDELRASDGLSEEYRGVAQQLVQDLVHEDRPELVDLRHRKDGFKDLLRTGLSMLTSKKARKIKHPLDNSTVILFIVGGITAEEYCKIQHIVNSSGIDNTFIVGSTKLANPTEAMKDVLAL